MSKTHRLNCDQNLTRQVHVDKYSLTGGQVCKSAWAKPLQGKHCTLSNAPVKFRAAFASLRSGGMVSATTATQLFSVLWVAASLLAGDPFVAIKQYFFFCTLYLPQHLSRIPYTVVSVHLISVHRTAISSTKLKLFMKGHNVSLSLCCLKRWQQKCISMALIFFGVFKNSVSPEIYRSLVQFLWCCSIPREVFF